MLNKNLLKWTVRKKKIRSYHSLIQNILFLPKPPGICPSFLTWNTLYGMSSFYISHWIFIPTLLCFMLQPLLVYFPCMLAISDLHIPVRWFPLPGVPQGPLPLETPHSFFQVLPNPVGLWHHLWSFHWTSLTATRALCVSAFGQPSFSPDANPLEDNSFCSS